MPQFPVKVSFVGRDGRDDKDAVQHALEMGTLSSVVVSRAATDTDLALLVHAGFEEDALDKAGQAVAAAKRTAERPSAEVEVSIGASRG